MLWAGVVPGRVHGAADAAGAGGGRAGQLRAGEGAGAAERRARALLRPEEPLHPAAGHRPAHHQQGHYFATTHLLISFIVSSILFLFSLIF